MAVDGVSESGFGEISRRHFLQKAGLTGGVVLGGPALLGACGSSTASTASVGKPRYGGVLRIGQSAGGSSDTLDPQKSATLMDYARAYQLFDGLVARNHQFQIVPALGTEFSPSSDGREMVVKLRDGVTFHDGKPFTSADVVFSFRRMIDPKFGADSFSLFAPFIDSVEPIDRLSVRFRFKLPFYRLEDFAGVNTSVIVPVDFNPAHPIGTGPFKYQSFTPGQQSVFMRNEHYWGAEVNFLGSGGPYVDSVVIHDIGQDSTRVNALVSGAVDAIDSVPAALLPSVEGNSSLEPLISKTGNWFPLTMRVDQPPFDDNRVREAFRLIVDRPQMIADAYDGRAQLGNDLYGITDPLYAHQIPQREQDIEKAKFLLKQAGHENLTVNLVTAPIEANVDQQCVVFAQQAKAAGVTVQITQLDTTTFFGPQYLKRTFSVDDWGADPWCGVTAAATLGTGNFNETHWNNLQFNKWFYELIGTGDTAKQMELALLMQEQLWNEGGYIIPAFADVIDAHSTKVAGFVPDTSGFNLSSWQFREVWLT